MSKSVRLPNILSSDEKCISLFDCHKTEKSIFEDAKTLLKLLTLLIIPC